ncbi:hypothetical protein [Rudaea cellulosilytica]|uniref:hypothetical protein n=1 Tax=Rudaea cellulosilytica TaxID=540746 RepID=UPI0012F9E19E|nr:hypothetical protein [Rudaea cellulosilytica]
MKKSILRLAVFLFMGITSASACQASSTEKVGGCDIEKSVRNFLRQYLIDAPPQVRQGALFAFSSVKSESGFIQEVIVYVSGKGWCGSGGCNLIILAPQKDGYTVIGESGIVKLPIRLLSEKTNGLPNIGVWVQGGGVLNGYEVALPFDGKRYASNPTIPPAKPVPANSKGRVLIEKDQVGKPVY